jgi:uncharacterized LabA/DUF88 family protein
MLKVIAYIDGFNLYHGLNDRGWRRYLWLDIQKMAESLLMFNQELVLTKYFTARIIVGSEAKKERQTTYIEALETLNFVEIIEGRYHLEQYECYNCNFIHNIPSEKMTDVNIATEMILDAYKDKYQTALLVSGDADLVPAVNAVRGIPSNKHVVVAFPPERYSKDLEDAAPSFHIGRIHFAHNLLPDKVTRDDGFILERPTEWH